jgi:cytochrome P450
VGEAIQVVDLTTLADVRRAFRSPYTGLVTKTFAREQKDGTVNWLNGSAHAQRRRALNQLVRPLNHERFFEDVIDPTVRSAVDNVLRSSETPVDLVTLCRSIFVKFAIVFVGLDIPATDEGVETLLETFQPIAKAFGFDTQHDPDTVIALANDPERGTVLTAERISLADAETLADAERGVDEFAERFYEPALARRAARLDEDRKGALDPENGFVDLITLIAAGSDARWLDEPRLGLREAINMVVSAQDTSIQTFVHIVAELERWFERYPEARTKLSDSVFLERAAFEAMRLHPITPELVRQAFEDVAFEDGKAVGAGSCLRMDLERAATDATIFGADAGDFDPNRAVPSELDLYGIAFGTGRHQCLGLPIVVGAGQLPGTHVHLLERLYEAGMERDRFAVAVLAHATSRDIYASYPVTFCTPPSTTDPIGQRERNS